ncbi:membrane protein required for colicin V production [Gillisia mitskevichiae]|uniref:Membrane protein required for colicin V production n=1 Tax=Gillisia mitskevichiae TaxID=270921 RepID=A0A495PYI5_9FLAO|nr:CvpA family protein [Gillisia mitskevichiae]RKS55473.1 membrane protein required for colicin V production [Gillisia mitskevichiae]
MNIVDIILGVILLYGLVRGFFRGFFAELASLVGFILGIYIAVYFSHYISDYLVERVSWNMRFVNLASFAITFILVVFLISLAGKFLTKIASFAALGILNKFIGAGFGFIKVAFVVSVVIMFFGSTNENIHIVEQQTLEESTLYAPIRTIAPLLLPAILREAKELDLIKEEESEA